MKNLLKVILRKRQNGNKKPKWGMRKLSKGLVSCLLGFSMLISLTTNVYAKVAWGTDGEGVNPLKRAKFYNVKEGTVLPADKYPTATATTPAKPKINDVTENDKTISGKGIPRAKVNITKENADKSGQGTEIAKDVEVRNDGTWTAKVPDGVTLTKGDIIYATQNVDGKNFSDQAEATVKAADTQVEAPTLKANDDGSVTVTPPADQDVDGVLITYIDEKNHQGTLAVTKGDDGAWILPKGTDPSITIDPATGAVTIPANQVKDGSEVEALAEKNSIHSDEVKVKAKNNPVTKKEVTRWVLKKADGKYADLKRQEDGKKIDNDNKSDIDGYYLDKTVTEETDTTITYINIYKVQLAAVAKGLDGKELKEATIGYNKETPDKFDGYTYLFDEGENKVSEVQGKKAYLVNRIYAKNPAVVEVKNTNSLTSDEQKAVKVAVKTENPDLLDNQISVNEKGEVTITRGKQTATLDPSLTVVKKGQKDAEKNDPKGQDISAKVGDTLKPEDGIKNKGDLTNVKSYTFKDPVDTKTPGKKDAVVVVKYNDGSEDKVDVKVNVKAWKDFFTAKGGELVVSKGTNVVAHDVYEKVKLIYNDQTFGVNDKNNIPLPIGNKSNAWLYVDSNKLPTKDSKVGQYTQNVFIDYPDGSRQIVQVIVKVVEGQTDAEKYEPKVEPVEKEKGTAVTEKDITDAVKVPDFKENPKFPGQTPKVTVDETSKLPDGNTVGTTNVAVTVTYPDGSTDKLTVEVKVKDTTPTEKEFDKENITNIAITTPPTKTEYTEGEKFDPAGMKVTLTDKNGKKVEVPAEKFAEYGIKVPAEALTKDQTKVEVKVKDKKAEQAITVKEKEVVPKINRTGMPVINNAKAGDEKITGTAEPGATLTVTTPEGVKTVVANADGKWEVTLGTPLAEGDVIKAIAKANGKGDSNEASVTVGKANPIADQVTPAIPKESTPVENPTNLTKEEKEIVKKKVEEANKGNFPSGTKVEIGADGTATITYPDNSQDKIKGSDLVVKKKVVSKKPTNKKLPKTSITGTGLSGVMIGLAGIGLSVLKKNKRED